MQGEGKLAQKDARPDPGAKTEGEGEGNSFRDEEDGSDQDIVDLGQKTEPAGKGIENGEDRAKDEGGGGRLQRSFSVSLSVSLGNFGIWILDDEIVREREH